MPDHEGALSLILPPGGLGLYVQNIRAKINVVYCPITLCIGIQTKK